MQTLRATARNPLGRRLVAALFLVVFLGISLVSASHQLHHAVHHDASVPNHECVFVQISQGQLLMDAILVFVPVPLAIESLTVSAPTSLSVLSRDYILVPGRAPPVSPA